MGVGEDVGAFLLDGILGGQHHEGVGQWVDDATDRRLTFLHRLEHGGLSLRAGTVDLVEQDDVGVHRAQLGAEGCR